MKPPPLKIVVLYNSGHLGSTILLNKIMRMPDYEVIGLIRATPIKLDQKGLKRLQSHWNKIGWKLSLLLALQSIIQSLITLFALAFPKRLRPAWRLSSKNNIPTHNCRNINELNSIDFIKSLQPDLMISAYFPQILKQEVIALPRLGTLNLHPGWLPSFQGAMVYFWALKQGVPRAGVSLHWIDEGIDTGDLIERKSFAIHDGMTQEQVLVKTAFIGSQLIKRVGNKLRQEQKIKAISCLETPNYFPLPNQNATEAYLKKHRFFRLRDLFGILNRPL